MGSLTFVINDASTGGTNPQVQVTISEDADGTLSFAIAQLVSNGAYVGDLRGFFFDLANESLISTLELVSTSATTGALRQGNDSVVDLGGGATMSGLTNAEGLKVAKLAGAEQNGYDAGFEIGTSGIGTDDVRSLSFTLGTTNGTPLSLADFANVDFGIRVTSVGQVDAKGNFVGPREGSSKLAEHTVAAVLDAKNAVLDATPEDTTAEGSLFTHVASASGATKEVTGFVLDEKAYEFSATVTSHTVELPNTQGATITIHADGRYTIDALDADAMSLGVEIAADLTYTVRETSFEKDGSVAATATDTASLRLTISGTNDEPVITAASSVVELETEQGVSAEGSISFTDVDLADRPEVSAVFKDATYTGADGTSKALSATELAGLSQALAITPDAGHVNNGTATWAYSATDEAVDFLAKDETVVLSYTLEVDDSKGGKATQEITVTITGTNDGPVAAADVAAGEENESLTIDVLANDEDVDNGAVLSLVSASAPDGKGTASVEGGQLVFNPGTAFDHLAAGAQETVTLSYTITDEHGAESTSTVDLTITGTNDDPEIVIDQTTPSGGVKEAAEGPGADPAEGATLSDTGTISFTDVDEDDTHTATVQAQGAGYFGSLELGTVDQNSDTVDWTFFVEDELIDFLSAGETLTQNYDVTVSDGNGGSVVQTVAVILEGTNDKPDAVDDSYAALEAGQDRTFTTVLANDTDVDEQDGLSVSAINGVALGDDGTETIELESGALVTIKADGTFSYDDNGAWAELYEGASATETFQYTLSDGKGGLDTATVTFDIEGIGQAPEIEPPPPPPPVSGHFPGWPQDISHFTLYFKPNLGGDAKPRGSLDGVYTVKIDVPGSFPDDMDATLDTILGHLRAGGQSGRADPYPFIDANTELFGVAIKGGNQMVETYYALDGNTTDTDPVPTPTGTLVTNSGVDLDLNLAITDSGDWQLVVG